MVAKDYHKTKTPTKAEVGEIDTSAPFQSVKDAVSLFGEGAFSGEKPAIKKPKPQSADKVLAKETELHLAQKELNKLQERLKNAETTKSEALLELDRAKKTVEDLSTKLKSINESKDSAISAAEISMHQAKQLAEANNDLSAGADGSLDVGPETSKTDYSAVVSELDAAKQELGIIRQEYEASVKAKVSASEKTVEAENAYRLNRERAHELSEEIASVHESTQLVILESRRAKEVEMITCTDMDKQKELYKIGIEEIGKKLLGLKKDIDPELNKNLESQLGEALLEVESLRNEMENKKATDLDSLKAVALDLDSAKTSLNKAGEEEVPLKRMVETLTIELDEVKKERQELKQKELDTESNASNLHVKLTKVKIELEEALAEEAKARGASDEMIATIRQLAAESRDARHEAEENKRKVEELKREAEYARIELEEVEKKLISATHEAEEAKAAEARALDRIKTLSEKTDAARASVSESGAHITISQDEFESVSRKAEESEKLAEMKVSAAMAQVEAVRASENEAVKRLEASRKEIEEMKAATQEALKKAEMAEAARKAVEGELRRWREREQKKAEEAASRILAEAEKSIESSPRGYGIQKQKPEMETRKLEKAKTSVVKKVLSPSLGSVFHKKKNQVEGGSPS